MRASPHELEELLAHGPWVRELARSLVRDPSRADDLAQQAWLKTLERPPAPRSSPRGWFATVLRNLAREEHRADLRRAAREQLAATRGTEALGVTLELSTQLAQALAGLAEPYRSAIFRRYYEGLAPRRIAAQDGIPLKTVKTRLARGLEQLRERLDREHDGDRGAWVMACAPLLRGSATPPILGGIIMNAKLACALAGLVLLGAWAVMHGTHSDRPQPSAALERDLARDPSAHEIGAPVTEDSLENARQIAEATRTGTLATSPPMEAQLRELPGRIVDPGGLGLAGVRLICVTPQEAQALRRTGANSAAHATAATSGPDGRFRLKAPPKGVVLLGELSGFVTVLASDIWSGDLQKELLLVMAPSIDIAGVVVDEQDRPIPATELRVSGDGVRRGVGLASDTAVDIPWTVRSDEQGHFSIESVPGVASVELAAFHPRFKRGSLPMPEHSRSDLRVVLGARESTVLAGKVVDRSGLPVAQALVAMGQEATRTDAEGQFELELKDEMISFNGVSSRPTLSEFLSAVQPGRLTARMQKPTTGWPGFVTLVIGDEPLSIRGRVLDHHGAALAGVEVRATNEHPFGKVVSGVGNFPQQRSVEGVMRDGDSTETHTRTDDAGEFDLRGLLDEEYVLQAFDPKSMRLVLSEPLHAGRRGIEIRFGPPEGVQRVAGRVLSLHGEPVAGVNVFPQRPGIESAADPVPRPVFGSVHVTDADGRFDFGEIAVEGLVLQLSGKDIQPLMGWTPPEGAQLSELELHASRRCHLQIDLGDRKEMADCVLVLDEHDQQLVLWTMMGNVSSTGIFKQIRDGKSDVFTVPENAATIVLRKDGIEVQRRPVALKPGELEIVRF